MLVKAKSYLFLLLIGLILSISAGFTFLPQQNVYAARPTSNCRSNNGFFELPTWYEYLPNLKNDGKGGCVPDHNNPITLKTLLSDFLGPVALAILDILLHISGIVAVGLIILGGIKYTTSQGSPDGTKKAKDTILNALIGLVIAILAIAIVKFVGGQF